MCFFDRNSRGESFAEKEFEILKKISKEKGEDFIIQEFEKEILAVCKKFSESGQSGGSAPYTASAIAESINRLSLFKPLTPLTGNDSEWEDVSSLWCTSKKMFQNKRLSSVFKNEERAYFIDAIVFQDENGNCFTGSALLRDEKIGSSQFIKEFPFIYKTFYVDVYFDIKKDEYCIEDELQLVEVFDYYDEKRLTEN